MKADLKALDSDKYRVKPVKVTKKRNSIKSNLTGEDIDLLNDNKERKTKTSICDIHEDGA